MDVLVENLRMYSILEMGWRDFGCSNHGRIGIAAEKETLAADRCKKKD